MTKMIDDSMKGLLQCDCEVCDCIQPVEVDQFFNHGGMCDECNDGQHEEEDEHAPPGTLEE